MLNSTVLIAAGIPSAIAVLGIVHLWFTRNDGAIELALEEAKVNFIAKARSANHQAVQYARKGMPVACGQSLKARDILMDKARWAEAELQKAMTKRSTC